MEFYIQVLRINLEVKMLQYFQKVCIQGWLRIVVAWLVGPQFGSDGGGFARRRFDVLRLPRRCCL